MNVCGLTGSEIDRIQLRLTLVRQEMEKHQLDAYIVPRADEYLGEYVPPQNERLAWLTGFTGSAGTAVVLKESAAIFEYEYRENKRPAEVAAPSSGSLRTLSQSHSRRRAAGICGPFAGFSPRLGIRQAGLANSERRQPCRTQHRPFVFGRP